ncbi:MAG: phosphoribosylanthranilate isomerase [Oscillospiraceae bacterium]|nr:phosphoribosylanthranilate isomerase [Oscillospiraceae bacterium]
MNTYLKICGIRRMEDVQYLNEFPPDFAGFICAKPYWRYVPPEDFRMLCRKLRGEIGRVGVFVNPAWEDIEPYAPYLDKIQLHGNETAELIAELHDKLSDTEIWKAVRVQSAQDIADADALGADKLVLDSFSVKSVGGTGELAPWDIIAKHRPFKPFLLAGGITPENVRQAIADVSPWGVDASSSLETDRCKDREKIYAMTEAVQNPLYCFAKGLQT